VTLNGSGPGGPPCVADFNGDGNPEIGVANRNFFAVFNGAGTLLWQHGIDDGSSGSASCSAFDFNADGKYEIAYRDERNFYILGDGVVGNVIWQTEGEPSYTACEMPVIADVDNDRHAEIVLPLNNYNDHPYYPTGIQVWGNAQWAWSRKIWNEHTYHITNIKDDAKVPTPEPDNWLHYNNYRTQEVVRPLPAAIGGIAEFPPAAMPAESGAAAEGSGWATATYAALAGAVVAIGVGGWYARRRWLR
jgi:hypothetical protein